MLSWIIFLPLFASIIVGSSYKYNLVRFSQFITICCVATSMFLAAKLFSRDTIIHYEYLFNWIKIGELEIKWQMFADKLTLVMLLIITSVSLAVHIYSIGYMSDDPTQPKFLSYLSLFTFFMLALVTSSNLLQLFFGWEGVGLCSYLLIGYWYKKNAANKAAMKAFIVNRVADVAFIVGLVMIYNIFNTLEFITIFERLTSHDVKFFEILGIKFNQLDIICLLLLIGSMGKSAQLGLHIWLPDAMEGPTPISALIHAATMVTAGVFLIARYSPLFAYSPLTANIMLIIGSLTCLFGAIVAIGQNDVKKIIAYSTCSQLGYMFMACGIKAYNIAIFHLATHAFFKALLFLSAGSIIYATHHKQDIRKMGNLWMKLPVTYCFMMIGTISITGIYPFSGHYSKDAILEALYLSNDPYSNFAYISGIITVLFTAIYSLRLICKIFHGPSYFSEKEEEHIHEPPNIMSFPLYVLAICSMCAGYVLKEKFFILGKSFWHSSVVMDHIIERQSTKIPHNILILPQIITFLGFAFIIIDHLLKNKIIEFICNIFSKICLVVRNKFYFDELYKFIFVDSHKFISKFSAEIFDTLIIDKIMVNNFGKYFPFLSKRISIIQSGYIYNYVTIMILFVIIALTYIIFQIQVI